MSGRAIAEKSKVVEGLKEKIAKAKLVIVSDYRGLTVKEFTSLRRKLRSEDSEIHVIKNTLIERAFAESGIGQLNDQLKGSTALLLGYGDAVSPLKALVKFLKEIEKGGIRAGVVEKNLYEQKEMIELSKLPAKEVLIGKVVGGFKAPLFGLVNVLQGPIRKLVYALDAIKTKKGGE
jgi:large subunit ribosomal protein L10